MDCSELPIIVDLTAKSIYVSYRPLSDKALRERPVLCDPRRIGRLHDVTNTFHWEIEPYTPFCEILHRAHCQISLEGVDFAEVQNLLYEWSDAPYYLSVKILKALGIDTE